MNKLNNLKMNRDIKFRGIKEDGRFFYGGYFCQRDIEGVHHMIYDQENNTSEEFKGSTVDQYTGLTDKNGVEIYENDLMQYQFEEDDIETFKVVWHFSGWCTTYKWWDKFTFQRINSFVIDNAIVVGNIHENKELWV